MYVSVYQIVEIHFLDVSWRFPFTNPFSKNTIVATIDEYVRFQVYPRD